MRAIVLLGLFACAGPVRPAVMPNMQNLPTDPQERTEQMEAQVTTPSADSRKGMSEKAKAAETAAATAAAFIGSLFSSAVPGSSEPAFLFGAASPMEEVPGLDRREKKKDAGPPEDATEGNGEPLVPWIKIRPDEAP